MPIQSCSENGKPGYKWGEEGFCYTYTPGNELSHRKARRKAYLQGVALDYRAQESRRLQDENTNK